MKAILEHDMRMKAAAWVVAGAIALSGAVRAQQTATSTQPTTAKAAATAKQPVAPTAQKKALCGPVTMGELAFLRGKGGVENNFDELNAHPNVYVGVVVIASWRDIEPAQGKFNFGEIDHALANIQKYNAAHQQHPVVGKLRVYAAGETPVWAQTLGGAPVKITDKRGTHELGRFWTPEYMDAWRGLQAALAARYDADPLMGEVAVSECTSGTAEPFVIWLRGEDLPAWREAGFTDAKYKACLMSAIDDYAVWKQTPIDYTFNGFRNVDSGTPVPDADFPVAVMKAFRGKYGARGVLANHGLDTGKDEPGVEAMAKIGPPIEFQAVSQGVSWDGVVQLAIHYGATEMEFNNSKDAGGTADFSLGDLVKWKAEMQCGK